jgi:hypothetical protein
MALRWNTIIEITEEEREEAHNILEAINAKDPSFEWRFSDQNGQTLVIVTSIYRNKAQARGKWLTQNVSLFQDRKYYVTKGSKGKRPTESISLQELEKRREQFGVSKERRTE